MSTPVEPPIPIVASMPAASVEPSSSVPANPDSSQPGSSPRPGSGSRSLLVILLPIILMVLSLGGVGATLLYANHQAAPQGAGGFPGQYNGQRPSGFPSGGRARPSGFPTDGTMPSGFPTDGTMPSGFPTGGNFPGGGQRLPGQRPAGGNGTYQRYGQPPGMHLNGLEVGVISGCGVIFVGSAVFLAIGLVNRRKPTAVAVPPQSGAQ